MKVGIIGFGAWGSIHAASVAALPGDRLAALCCRSEESAAQAREQYPQAVVCTDYRQLLEMQDVEAVHVVVPSHLHADIALAALKAGKHVLLEKPMATTLEDCQRIVQAAEKAEAEHGQVTSIVHELRCSGQWSAVRKAVDAGEIGLPRYAMLNLFRFPYRQGKGNWRYDPDKVGSWVLEEPIHFFDLLLWYMEAAGKPLAVTAYTNEHSPGLCRDFTAIVEFDSGAYAVVSQTLSGFEHHQIVEVTGSAGAVRSIWSGAMDRTDKPDWSVRVKGSGQAEAVQLDVSEPSGELFEIGRYIDLAHTGFTQGKSIYQARQEMELIRLCLAAEGSARTRSRVTLP